MLSLSWNGLVVCVGVWIMEVPCARRLECDRRELDLFGNSARLSVTSQNRRFWPAQAEGSRPNSGRTCKREVQKNPTERSMHGR